MEVDKFVIEISKHPELYDLNNARYKDRKFKDDIYQEVGMLFDLSGKIWLKILITFSSIFCLNDFVYGRTGAFIIFCRDFPQAETP